MSRKATSTMINSAAQPARTARPDEPAKVTSDAPVATTDAPGPAPAPAPTPPAATPAATAPGATSAQTAAPGAAPAEKKAAGVQVVTRFPLELCARLDRFTDSIRDQRFGLRVSRSDAVRILVHEALLAHDTELGAHSK